MGAFPKSNGSPKSDVSSRPCALHLVHLASNAIALVQKKAYKLEHGYVIYTTNKRSSHLIANYLFKSMSPTEGCHGVVMVETS